MADRRGEPGNTRASFTPGVDMFIEIRAGFGILLPHAVYVSQIRRAFCPHCGASFECLAGMWLDPVDAPQKHRGGLDKQSLHYGEGFPCLVVCPNEGKS